MQSWTRGEKWTAAGVILALFTPIAGFFIPEGRRVLRLDKSSATKPPAAISVSVAKLPNRVIFDTGRSVKEMRDHNHVTRIRETESDESLSEIPPHSFGFVDPLDLVLDSAEELRVAPYGITTEFEVDKLSDNQSELVAYVGPETFEHLRQGLGGGEKVTLFSDQWKDAPNVVAVTIGTIRCMRKRQVEEEAATQKRHHFLTALDCEGR